MTDEPHYRELLRIALQAAVPLHTQTLIDLPFGVLQRITTECAQIVASKGDVLMYGGRGCAEAFNALARGIAALSFQPGGVTFLGDHWEHEHPDVVTH